MTSKKVKLFFLPAAFFLLGGIAVFFIYQIVPYERECNNKFRYINPRFACLEKHVLDKSNYTEFKHNLISFIDGKKKSGNIQEISVYFRDLESGPIFGIDETKDFIPASLLKFPHTLAFLRIVEQYPEVLDHSLGFQGFMPSTKEQAFPSPDSIKEGEIYTIDELIFYTLAYSDNNAHALLVEYFTEVAGPQIFSDVYRDLGILEKTYDTASVLHTKGYASIFRMLYNVSFLNKESSEKVLSILSQSSFNEGLREGIPADIEIAHKFGERFLSTGEKQLHDCGIVYYPGNPYLLCVMTQGDDFAELSDVIGAISKKVYEEVDSRKIQ